MSFLTRILNANKRRLNRKRKLAEFRGLKHAPSRHPRSGNKLRKKARNSQLTIVNRHGVVGEAITNIAKNKNAARMAQRKVGA
jgi:hypothetical protein